MHSLNPLFVGSTGPAVSPSILPIGTIAVTLLYEYTPATTVPEPATALLLCLGLALLRARSRS